ncbi:phytase [Rugamonas rubra]|uniref:3-phytase n=1 Tax=Rugamonas rubra TaxID=758825 RepID=A0A1I4PHD0_9BURK|nr:phytase [Rugamonas rubra]SFM27219.1 3-phytase [Rugamonas rubra]
MSNHTIKSAVGAALLTVLTTPAFAASSAIQHTPGATARAQELAALPDGGWLTLDKHGLHLLDAAGKERAALPMRAKQLDIRSHADGALAMVLDANTNRAQIIIADTKAGQLRPQAQLPAPSHGIESACLFRDAQQLDHLFLIAKDGQAEQWVLHGEQRQLVRKLALPPHVKHCRVDDASQTLLVSESGVGLWAYDADAEGVGSREPVALRAPYGKLEDGAGALAVLPGGGVALLDAKGKTLHLLRQRDGVWQAVGRQSAGGAKQLAVHLGAGAATGADAASAAGGRTGTAAAAAAAAAGTGSVATPARAQPLTQLLLPDEGAKSWQIRPLAWQAPKATATQAAPLPIIEPRAQTEPMARPGDAADDPAIWLHPTDRSASRVLGTNKKQGLLVYDLQGKQLQLLEVGRLNNVDLRQNVQIDQQRYDLAVATQRDDNTLVLFNIDANGDVNEAARFPTGLDKIYGICSYQPAAGGLEVFINDKDGTFLQYRIGRQDGRFASTLLRKFKVASQPEGCVADDRNARLYLGEEKRGVWVTSADAAKPDALAMALPVGPHLTADVEGMALYHGAKADYLVVSSQGSNSYVVLDARPPYKVRGGFRIGFNLAAGIDGTSETDGLDVTSANLGGAYAKGMLVVQDGYKRLPDGAQNFKYVAWEDVARALKLD